MLVAELVKSAVQLGAVSQLAPKPAPAPALAAAWAPAVDLVSAPALPWLALPALPEPPPLCAFCCPEPCVGKWLERNTIKDRCCRDAQC